MFDEKHEFVLLCSNVQHKPMREDFVMEITEIYVVRLSPVGLGLVYTRLA